MLDFKKIKSIIESHNFSDFVGEIEGESLDGKQQLYALDSENQKFELAKDVISFANSEGGFIIMGVSTKRSDVYYTDQIDSLKPFNRDQLNVEQYIQIIGELTYPEIKKVRIYWVPEKEGAKKGFGIIEIPKQSRDYRPFLMKKTLMKEGKKNYIIFGFSQRKSSMNDPSTIQDLHQYLRDGLNFGSNINEQLTKILRKLDEPSGRTKPPQGSNSDENNPQKISKTLVDSGLIKERYLSLSIGPTDNLSLKDIFSEDSSAIVNLLEHPESLRQYGWNMETLDSAKIIEGKLLRVMNGNRKVIDLYRDGTIVFSCSAGHDFLGWSDPTGLSKIHTLALIEVIYEFFRLYEKIINLLTSFPIDHNIEFRLGNMKLDNKPAYLIPSGHGSYDSMFNTNKQIAPGKQLEKKILLESGGFTPGHAAYLVIKEIFLWFGVKPDSIPYTTKKEGGKDVISKKEIKNVK